jgi:virulence factor Mce-like protein
MVERKPHQKRKRPLEELNKTALGTTALVLVTLFVATLLIWKAVSPGYRHYTAEFAQAAGLKEGNAVTIAGVPVGQVTSMKLVGDHVETGLRVRDSVRLGKQSRVSIMTLTILGGRYVSLRGEGSGSVPNNTFDLAHTAVPYDLQEALGDATTTFEQTNFKEFGQSLSILGTQMKGVPELVPQALANLDNLSSVIGKRRDQIGSLLRSTQEVTNTLRTQQATVGSLINQGNALLGDLVAKRESLHAMLQGLTNLVQTVSKTVVTDRARVEATLTDLQQLTELLNKHDDLLRSFLQSAPIALRGLANASGTGNAADLQVTNGIVIDSWMCAISGRARQFGFIQYFKDCK